MFTRPILLIPVALQVCFVVGLIWFASLFIFFFTAGTLNEGSAFTTMMMLFLYIFIAPMETIPPGLITGGSISTTVMQGALSWEYAIVTLIIGVVTLVAAVATAYTKALTLGIIRDAAAKKHTAFVELWQNGRRYWPATIKYYILFGVLLAFLNILIIPLFLLTLQYGATGLVLLGFVFIMLLFRFATVFADALIVNGSTKPVRESLLFMKNNFLFSFVTNAVLVVIGVLVFALLTIIYQFLLVPFSTNYPRLAIILVYVVFTVLVSWWRLWVAAYVVVRGQRRIPA